MRCASLPESRAEWLTTTLKSTLALSIAGKVIAPVVDNTALLDDQVKLND